MDAQPAFLVAAALASLQAPGDGTEETLGRKLNGAWPGWGRPPHAHSLTFASSFCCRETTFLPQPRPSHPVPCLLRAVPASPATSKLCF